jgi:hypothetical protein
MLHKNIFQAFNITFGIFKKNFLYKKELPVTPISSDIYIVSFPRSGNTWFRFLVANAIRYHFDIEQEVNFFSIQDIIPDVQVNRHITTKGPFGLSNIPRIIKSHVRYMPTFNRVIYLVRDPRDVYISYYHYLLSTKNIPQALEFSDFLRHSIFGLHKWNQHVQSWTSSQRAGQIIQHFTFEDILRNPKSQLKRFMDLLGYNISNESLDKAIEASSKETMRKSEGKHRSTGILKSQQSFFVREGKANKGKSLTTKDRIYIEKKTRNYAKLCGYEL